MPKTNRPSALVLALSIAAAAIDGLLAGGNIDRAVVARPAWEHVGLAAWANYTRSADLANGRFFYPALAFSGTLLCVLAALLIASRGWAPKRVAWPTALAAGCMGACLPISLRAAPFILSLRSVDNSNLVALTRAFEGSFLWGRGQMILHTAAFLANLWAISAASDRGIQESI